MVLTSIGAYDVAGLGAYDGDGLYAGVTGGP